MEVLGGGRFLMSEVPLCYGFIRLWCPRMGHLQQRHMHPKIQKKQSNVAQTVELVQ